MNSVALTVYPRTQIRRGALKGVRSQGRVPAVVYGRLNPPQNLEIGAKELTDLIHGSATENLLVDLTVQGDTRPARLALVQEVQHHALSGKVLHVDFHEVSPTEKVTVLVPVETAGEPVGVKSGGGVLEHVLFRVKVRAFPKDLPEALMVDVTHLDLGKSIHIGELQAPAGVEILGDKKIVVISVALPKTEAEEAAEATATTAAQPEMIKEKKEEGEAGAEGADKAKKDADKGAKKEPEKAKKEPEKKEAAKPKK